MKGYDLFSGLGGFSLAAHRAIPGYETVLWSEIDKHAVTTFKRHFPEVSDKNVGDIHRTVFDIDSRGRTEANEFRVSCLPDVNIVMGGSPCQDLSIAKGKREGLDGSKSGLFWAFSEIVRIKKPKYFLLENVASMDRASRDTITEYLETDPVEINSVHFTGQKRKRLYWFNWILKEEPEANWSHRREDIVAWSSSNDYCKITGKHLRKRERETRDGYANTLGTGKGCAFFSSVNKIILPNGERRFLTPEECEGYQGLPSGWTSGHSDSQRYKQIGNAITVPVVEFILRSIPHV